MNKKMFRYFCAILIFLFIINIGMISASEIDQSTDAFSNQILSDDSGVNEVLTDDPEGCLRARGGFCHKALFRNYRHEPSAYSGHEAWHIAGQSRRRCVACGFGDRQDCCHRKCRTK